MVAPFVLSIKENTTDSSDLAKKRSGVAAIKLPRVVVLLAVLY